MNARVKREAAAPPAAGEEITELTPQEIICRGHDKLAPAEIEFLSDEARIFCVSHGILMPAAGTPIEDWLRERGLETAADAYYGVRLRRYTGREPRTIHERVGEIRVEKFETEVTSQERRAGAPVPHTVVEKGVAKHPNVRSRAELKSRQEAAGGSAVVSLQAGGTVSPDRPEVIEGDVADVVLPFAHIPDALGYRRYWGFMGREEVDRNLHAVSEILEEYDLAVSEGDWLVLELRERWGIQAPAVMEPLYVADPVGWPVHIDYRPLKERLGGSIDRIAVLPQQVRDNLTEQEIEAIRSNPADCFTVLVEHAAEMCDIPAGVGTPLVLGTRVPLNRRLQEFSPILEAGEFREVEVIKEEPLDEGTLVTVAWTEDYGSKAGVQQTQTLVRWDPPAEGDTHIPAREGSGAEYGDYIKDPNGRVFIYDENYFHWREEFRLQGYDLIVRPTVQIEESYGERTEYELLCRVNYDVGSNRYSRIVPYEEGRDALLTNFTGQLALRHHIIGQRLDGTQSAVMNYDTSAFRYNWSSVLESWNTVPSAAAFDLNDVRFGIHELEEAGTLLPENLRGDSGAPSADAHQEYDLWMAHQRITQLARLLEMPSEAAAQEAYVEHQWRMAGMMTMEQRQLNEQLYAEFECLVARPYLRLFSHFLERGQKFLERRREQEAADT